MIFPSVVTFPLRQRLTLQGVFADASLPSPMAEKDDGDEDWSMRVDMCEDELDDKTSLQHVDGSWGENAPQFVSEMGNIEEMMAIQPDIDDGEQIVLKNSRPTKPKN